MSLQRFPMPPPGADAQVAPVFRQGQRWSRVAIRVMFAYTFILAVAGVSASYYTKWHFDAVWQGLMVGLLGIGVGITEISSRYRDSPYLALFTWPAMGYLAINGLASVGALAIIQTEGWAFGTAEASVVPTQLVVAGFGAMALFRSSLFTLKIGGQDVGVGPSSVLSALLVTLDRSVDRVRAADRAGRVLSIMAPVSYERAREPLPKVAVALMQNLDPGDVTAMQAKVDGIAKEPVSDMAKSLLLGLALTDLMSTSVLAAAKLALGTSILEPTKPSAAPRKTTRKTPASARRSRKGAPQVVRVPVAPMPDLAQVGGRPESTGVSEGLPMTPQTPDPDDLGDVVGPASRER